MALLLSDIFSYAKCSVNSKNAIEGEQVLNSKQIVLCGKLVKEQIITIKALIIQTSHIREMPHEVSGNFKSGDKLEIIQVKCTCAAGASECCKHVVAILLYLNRTSISDIDTLSSTDVRCEWSRLREPSLQQYSPVPIKKFCCCKPIIVPICNRELSGEDIRSAFVFASPLSALALHTKGRNLNSAEEGRLKNIDADTNNIEIVLTHNSLLDIVHNFCVNELKNCCLARYHELLDTPTEYIRNKSLKDKVYWKVIRQFRITGSRCYSLYTYNKSPKTEKQWALKASRYFWPKQFTNKFVKHGIEFESIARQLYSKTNNIKVYECGFITHSKTPWLGYSPDGVILDGNNKPIKLIEIKCPYKGSYQSQLDMLGTLSYIIKKPNGELDLKQNHAYYAQIQLGLVMLNVTHCDFIIYSSFDNTYHVILVDFNYDYCKRMLLSLKCVYFDKLLHEICKLSDNR